MTIIVNTTHVTTARNAIDLATNAARDLLVNAQEAKQAAEQAVRAAAAALTEANAALAAAEDEWTALIAAQEALKKLGGAPSHDLSEGELELFLAYVDDAGNWGGMPLLGGNVGSENPKSVEQLEEAGLINVMEDREKINGKPNVAHWVTFTEAGVALAAQHGRTIDA